jgi:hypothetical protein
MSQLITCITKDEPKNPYERITHVGGNGFYIPQAQAIRDIEVDPKAYYVSVAGNSVWVVVAVSRYGNKYIKTQNDGDEPNNLLSLPQCR